MKNIYLKLLVSLFLFSACSFAFAGGLPEDDNDLKHDLAKAQNDLDKERQKGDDLNKRLNDMQTKIDELANREPAVVEKAAPAVTWDLENFPIHGYVSTIYADFDLPSYNGTFDQEKLNFMFKYPIGEDFDFYGEIGYMHGADISVDLGEVSGVGDLQVVEAWFEWKAIEEKLIFRFGKFCSPFLNWSRCEIPTTTVSVFDPQLVTWSASPSQTTGIMEHGKYHMGNVVLTQAFGIGNGKADRPHSQDDNSDKALIGRLGTIIPLGIKEGNSLDSGISGFVGRDNSRDDNQQNAWGVDTKLNIGPVTLTLETMKSRLNADNPINRDENHEWKFSWFLQGSYNFLERFDVFYRYDKAEEGFVDVEGYETRINSVGLRFKPIERVAFKGQFDRYNVDNDNIGSYEVFSAQAAAEF